MLKIKVTQNRALSDLKMLEVTDIYQSDYTQYNADLMDDGVTADNDYYEVQVSVKDLYGIQPDMSLVGINSVPVLSEETDTGQTYQYIENVTVNSVSETDNVFTILKPKKMEIEPEGIYIETRFNVIKFVNNAWVIEKCTAQDLIDLYSSDDLVYWGDIEGANGKALNEVALMGKDAGFTLFYDYSGEEVTTSEKTSSTVFYYENNIWKKIKMWDEEIDEYTLDDDILKFKTFHEYDDNGRFKINLETNKVYYTKEDYIYFTCYPTHYITAPFATDKLIESENENPDGLVDQSETTQWGKAIVESIDYPIISFVYYDDDGNEVNMDIECHVDNDTQLSFNVDMINGLYWDKFKSQIFNNAIDYSLLSLKKGNNIININDIQRYIEEQEGNGGIFRIFCRNIMYDMSYSFPSFGYDMAVNVVKIPLGQKFETDLYHNDAVKTHFVDEQLKLAINPIMDMEKDVYTPAIQEKAYENEDEDGNKQPVDQINAPYKDCYKMIFNLHFRKHRGKDWKAINTDYWNGTRTIQTSKGKVIDLMGRVYDYKESEISGTTGKQDYFSYYKNAPQFATSMDMDIDYEVVNKLYKVNAQNETQWNVINKQQDRTRKDKIRQLFESKVLRVLKWDNTKILNEWNSSGSDDMNFYTDDEDKFTIYILKSAIKKQGDWNNINNATDKSLDNKITELFDVYQTLHKFTDSGGYGVLEVKQDSIKCSLNAEDHTKPLFWKINDSTYVECKWKTNDSTKQLDIVNDVKEALFDISEEDTLDKISNASQLLIENNKISNEWNVNQSQYYLQNGSKYKIYSVKDGVNEYDWNFAKNVPMTTKWYEKMAMLFNYVSPFVFMMTEDKDGNQIESIAKVYDPNGMCYTNYIDDRKSRNEYKEYQSDLLSFMGFNNDDIKYQKSKLKKSFIRLSFFDSDNIANQNLLHTATIFLDSGNYFAKYIKGFETYDELLASIEDSYDNNDRDTVYFQNGVRIDREPMRKNGLTPTDLADNISEWEDLRLSTQIEVTDKYSSKRSSEGFYFYTYKGNSEGVYPSEIYMRVDFNHAGYGRIIPFMMPYVRKSEFENDPRYQNRYNKIKTFDDICYDWSEYDYERDEVKDKEDVGYGTIRYMKYAYIKWKYRYDAKTEKHIYYLDPEVYGTSVTGENGQGNNIILNLYEGKIR